MSLFARLFRRTPVLEFVRLSKTALLPAYATAGSAGMDLYADEDAEIPFLKRALVKTNIAVMLRPDWEAQVRPRSGSAAKSGITVLNTPGTIDPDYTGGIGVILFNTDFETFRVKKGDRIAQLVINRFERVRPALHEDGAVMRPIETARARGASGFGSTGTGALAAASIAAVAAPVLSQTADRGALADLYMPKPVILSPAAEMARRGLNAEVSQIQREQRAFVWRANGSKEYLAEAPAGA